MAEEQGLSAANRKLEIVQNFQAHPGHYPEDRSADAYDAPSYRQGWADAVYALLDRVNTRSEGLPALEGEGVGKDNTALPPTLTGQRAVEELRREAAMTPAAWRRGVMFAVEHMDALMLRAPKAKKHAPAVVQSVRDALDHIAEFQRQHMPATYAEAFRLSEDENKRFRDALDAPSPDAPRPSPVSVGGSLVKPPTKEG